MSLIVLIDVYVATPQQPGTEGIATAGNQQSDQYYTGSQYEPMQSQQYATTAPTVMTPVAGQQLGIQQQQQQQPTIPQQRQQQPTIPQQRQQQQQQQQYRQSTTKSNEWKDDYSSDDSDDDDDDNVINSRKRYSSDSAKRSSSYSTRSQGTAMRLTQATANIVTKAITAPFKLIRLPRRSKASSYSGYTATPTTRTVSSSGSADTTVSRQKGKAASNTVITGTGSKEHALCIVIAILKGTIPAVTAMVVASMVDQIVNIKAVQFVVTQAYLEELKQVCYIAAAIATAVLALSATAEWLMRKVLQPRLLAHTATANYRALMRAVVTHSLLKVPSIPEASELVRSHYKKAISSMQLIESMTSLLSVIGVLLYSWPSLLYNELAQLIVGTTFGMLLVEKMLLALSKDRNIHGNKSDSSTSEQALSNIEALLIERGLNSKAAVEISIRNLGPWLRAKHTQLSKQVEPISTILLATSSGLGWCTALRSILWWCTIHSAVLGALCLFTVQQGSHQYTTGQLISSIAHVYIVRAALLSFLRALYDSRAVRPSIRYMNTIHNAAYSDNTITSDSDKLQWSGWEQLHGPDATIATR
jgi:hypothetical protein